MTLITEMPSSEQRPSIQVYHARQCDPSKCTGVRLGKLSKAMLVHDMRKISRGAVVLNPVSEVAFSPSDRISIKQSGLVALDCSWKLAEDIFRMSRYGAQRALPYLLAANPINTYKPIKLSTAEALAAALYIAGFQDVAKDLISVFKWGPAFITLNKAWLDDYSRCKDSTEIVALQTEIMEEHTRREE